MQALLLVRVGFDQLGNERKYLRRPAQDDAVTLFQHEGAALAQVLHLALHNVAQDADQ